jgi:hypothetical protein
MTRAAALLRTVAGQLPIVAGILGVGLPRKPVATGRPGLVARVAGAKAN